MKRILILIATLAVAGCATPTEPPKPAADPQADKAAIDKLRDEFSAAFNAGDAAKTGELYAETAVLMNADQATAEGRAAIVATNKALFDQFAAKITITPASTTVSGDLASDRGTYTMELTPKAGGKAIVDEGRYIVILHREVSGWKVIEDIGNHSAPATPPPAAPAEKK